MGSSNATLGGLGRNIELGVVVKGNALTDLNEHVEKWLNHGYEVDVGELRRLKTLADELISPPPSSDLQIFPHENDYFDGVRDLLRAARRFPSVTDFKKGIRQHSKKSKARPNLATVNRRLLYLRYLDLIIVADNRVSISEFGKTVLNGTKQARWSLFERLCRASPALRAVHDALVVKSDRIWTYDIAKTELPLLADKVEDAIRWMRALRILERRDVEAASHRNTHHLVFTRDWLRHG